MMRRCKEWRRTIVCGVC